MKRHYIPFFLAIAIIICFIPRTCEKNQPIGNPDKLKDTINHVKKQADSNKVVVVYKDSIRTHYVTKWKEIRHDSLMPCETKLIHCDTILLADSSLIYSLKQQTFLDSIIIGNYQKLSVRDSAKIAHLSKVVKRRGKIIKVLSVIAGGAIVGSVVR